MDQIAQQLQHEHQRRIVTIFVVFLSFFLLSFSYGIDEWGGDCASDHVATVFMLQRLASSCCIVAYLLEAYFVHSNEKGHTNPYLNAISKRWVIVSNHNTILHIEYACVTIGKYWQISLIWTFINIQVRFVKLRAPHKYASVLPGSK